MDKSLDVISIKDAGNKISDIKCVGDGDMMTLLCKASSKSQGWMKSTKAMIVPFGVVIQITTQQGDNVSEALTSMTGNYKIVNDVNGGKKIVEA